LTFATKEHRQARERWPKYSDRARSIDPPRSLANRAPTCEHARPPHGALVPAEIVQRVFPDESRFCFCLPPFHLLSDEPADEWRMEHARPDQLDHSKALLIADFQIGSDSAVVLDYAADPDCPPVKWLRWTEESDTYWDTACSSFAELAERLHLGELSFPPTPKRPNRRFAFLRRLRQLWKG